MFISVLKVTSKNNIEKEYVLALSNLSRFRILSVVILTLFLIVTAYGYTKANIIQENNSTDETSDISGYTITNIDYALLPNDPSKVRSITLDVAPANSPCETADARITVDNGATWITCTCPTFGKWVCSFPALNEPGIASFSNLQLVTETPVPWYKKIVFSILQIFNR